jgi:hypothetical protein
VVEDFCRGWLITGQVGTGKTSGAINTMLWQVSKNLHTWGGVCVDDKGLYWETLQKMMRHLQREQDLMLSVEAAQFRVKEVAVRLAEVRLVGIEGAVLSGGGSVVMLRAVD